MLSPGTVLGSYQILSALGAGGLGEVYRAPDSKLGRDVAIKILPEAFAADPDRLARFQREAQVLAALNHPHIAGIYGVEEIAGTRFLVLELVDGESLDARLKARAPAGKEGTRGLSRAGGLATDEALTIARQIVDAFSNYAVSPDGQRVLIARAATREGVSGHAAIAVVANWAADIKK
jgi:eukaryotic-like serine/threonine-protein kinase